VARCHATALVQAGSQTQRRRFGHLVQNSTCRGPVAPQEVTAAGERVTADTERGQDPPGRISGPLGGRGHRPGVGRHRCGADGQHGGQGVRVRRSRGSGIIASRSSRPGQYLRAVGHGGDQCGCLPAGGPYGVPQPRSRIPGLSAGMRWTAAMTLLSYRLSQSLGWRGPRCCSRTRRRVDEDVHAAAGRRGLTWRTPVSVVRSPSTPVALATSYGHLVDELVDGLSAATMDQRGGRLDGRPAASCADVGAGPGDRRAPATQLQVLGYDAPRLGDWSGSAASSAATASAPSPIIQLRGASGRNRRIIASSSLLAASSSLAAPSARRRTTSR
jgi:hypothetical protein